MRVRAGRWTTVLWLAGLAACSGSGEPDAAIAACYSGTSLVGQCFEQDLLAPDDARYAAETCRSGGGTLRDRCPTDNLVGVCSVTSNTATAEGFAPRSKRVHYYRGSDVRDAAEVARLASRCGAEGWRGVE
jgi:hypothetical protein